MKIREIEIYTENSTKKDCTSQKIKRAEWISKSNLGEIKTKLMQRIK